MPGYFTQDEPAIAVEMRRLAAHPNPELLKDCLNRLDWMIITHAGLVITLAERSPSSVTAQEIITSEANKLRAIKEEGLALYRSRLNPVRTLCKVLPAVGVC